MEKIACDVVICGDSLGGCSAALQLLDLGLQVVMVTDFPWVGGQLTSQAVPPDEHPWIEEFGSTCRYRDLRERIRAAYRELPLTEAAKVNPRLNPGGGWVSRICHDPRISAQILEEMLAEAGQLKRVKGPALRAEVKGDKIVALETHSHRLEADFFLDATELGDLLVLSGAEHVTGSESQADTGEPDAPEQADPRCQQGLTWCAAFGWDPEGDHTIEKPDQYERWSQYEPPNWTGRLFSFVYPNVQTGQPTRLELFPKEGLGWFTYRQIVWPQHWQTPPHAVSLVNWPQNDLLEGSLLLGEAEKKETLANSRQLTLSLLYWLQTEVGAKGLYMAPDILGTPDGFAQAPYIRESRRAATVTRLREQDVAAKLNPGLKRTPTRSDGVCVGSYRLDLHPRINGDPTLDISSLPYQIPLGCFVPVRITNLAPACKNIGVTHIVNGCTRLHPVEWCIGEVAGLLAAQSVRLGRTPQQIEASATETESFRQMLAARGVEVDWPEGAELRPL